MVDLFVSRSFALSVFLGLSIHSPFVRSAEIQPKNRARRLRGQHVLIGFDNSTEDGHLAGCNRHGFGHGPLGFIEGSRAFSSITTKADQW
jgi:hypothetical protein